MKKQWIIGALVAATGLQSSVPASAGPKQAIGTILGAGVGGALGSQIGGGRGQAAATIIGAAAGAVLGSKMGREMDEADRIAYMNAQRYCFQQGPNTSRSWNGRNARGTFRTGRIGYHVVTNEECYEYASTVYVNGRVENNSGYACYRSQTYYEVTASDVYFGERRSVENDRYAGPGYNNDYPSSRRRDRDDDYNRRRDRDDGYDGDDGYDDGRGSDPYRRLPRPPASGRIPPAPGGPIYTNPSNPGNGYPGNGYPPAPGYPQQPGYPGGIPGQTSYTISRVTRQEGGQWYRLNFDRSVPLSSITFQVRGSAMQVYSTAVVTDNGVRVQVPELSNTDIFYPQRGKTGYTGRPERVIAIDIRAEAFRGQSDLTVYFTSVEAVSVPRLQVFPTF